MPVSPSFAITPLARLLKLATFTPLLLISPTGLAQTLIDNGASETIGASTPVDNYLVDRASTLTANGAAGRQSNTPSPDVGTRLPRPPSAPQGDRRRG